MPIAPANAAARPWAAMWSLVLLYTLAHGLILVDQGVFWDDWTLYQMVPQQIITNCTEAGTPFFGWFHAGMSAQPAAVALYNWLTFGCYLASGLLIWRVLRHSGLLTPTAAWAVAALILVIPLNSARNAMINGQYAVCYVLFWAGLAAYQTAVQHRMGVLIPIAALLFFGSFLTNSFLVFFLIVPLYGLWEQRPNSLSAAIRASMRVAPWLLLPIVFWVLRSNFMPTSGGYALTHYNEITLGKLLRTPIELVRTFYFSFVKVLLMAPLALRSGVAAGVALLAGSILLGTRAQWWPAQDSSDGWQRRSAFLGVGVGLGLFALGAFPYLAVGLLPTQVEWSSRHQLLLPLGAALLLYFGLRLGAGMLPVPVRTRVLGAGIAVLLMVFVANNVKDYVAYERDWLKQLSLMRQLRQAPAVQANTTFVVDDHTRALNVFDRSVRFYEYAAQFKLIFGRENRFAADSSLYRNIKQTFPTGLAYVAGREHHSLGEYRVSAPQVRLQIEAGVALSDFAVLTRTLGHVTDTDAAPVVRLRTAPLTAAEAAALPVR